jgi:hypothetical protein
VIARQALPSAHHQSRHWPTILAAAKLDARWFQHHEFICGRPDLRDHCQNCRLHTERALSTAVRVVSDRFAACGRVRRYRYNTTNGHREPVSHRHLHELYLYYGIL